MSDYNRIQYSFFANGDQVVIRADDGDQMEDAAKSFAEHSGPFGKAVNAIKQAMVATGVFTGDSAKKGTSNSGSKERAADTPPPAASSPSSGSDVPTCKHGPMNDLRDKDYKYDFYCTLKTDNWKERCRPVKA